MHEGVFGSTGKNIWRPPWGTIQNIVPPARTRKIQEMRSTRQGLATPNRGEGFTLQQVMEAMPALQEEMAASRANQERIQANLAASQATNKELRRSNKELRRDLQTRTDEREGADQKSVTPSREFPTPFSQEIVDAAIPATLVEPKVTFTGIGDPEAHLTAFHTPMMLVGGSDAVRYKLFMSTLAGTAMDWFISLPDGHVTSFPQLTKSFRAQYITNRAPPPVSCDLVDVRQYQGESLKEFLHCFGAQVVRLNLKDEKMMVHAFRKGIVPGPFNESLIRNHPMTFVEIRRRAVEEEVTEKRTCVVPTRPRDRSSTNPKGAQGNNKDEDPYEAATLSTKKAQCQGTWERERAAKA